MSGTSNVPNSASDPFAGRRRVRTRVVAGVGAVVLGAVLLDTVAVLGGAALGERSWAQGDHAAARRWFELTDRVDVVQRWVAPYNLGVVAFSEEEWRVASSEFGRAAQLAAPSVLCTVLINQSASFEAWGDELSAGGDTSGAAIKYREAQSVLSRAEGCSDQGFESDESSDSEDKRPQDPAHDQQDEEESEPDPQESDPSDSEGEGNSDSDSDPQDGDGEGDSPESDSQNSDSPAEGSEQKQVDDATERLEQKLDDGRSSKKPQEQQPDSDTQAEQLADRNASGARQQQEAQDNAPSTGGRPSSPGRTW